MKDKKMFARVAVRLMVAIMLLSLAAPAALAAFRANVYTSSMKVYASKSTSSKMLGKLKKGTQVTVTSHSGDWAKITCRGRTGYAQIKDLISQKRICAYAKKDGTKVYKGASSSTGVLGELSRNAKVYVVGKSGSFLLVENKSGKARGYISKYNLSKKKLKKPNNDVPDDEDGDEGDGDPRTTMPDGLGSKTKKYDPSMSNSEKLEYVIYVAQNQLGKKYSTSPSVPRTFDCARLMYYCFSQASIKIPASAYSQGYDSTYTKIESASSLVRGDIVCFNTNSSDEDLSDHTGIYLGSGYFLHASSGAGKVIVSNLNSGYYSETFSWGRRILN